MSEPTEPAFLAVPMALAKTLDAMLFADPRVQAFLALRACLPVPVVASDAPVLPEPPLVLQGAATEATQDASA